MPFRSVRLPCVVGAFVCLSAASSAAWASRIFVSNERDNTITVLDGESLFITPVKQPFDRAAEPGLLFISAESLGQILDLNDGRRRGRVDGL